VGRQVDLRWLAWHWRRARHGHGSVVAISGLPGIGRTRLAAEAAAVALADGAAVYYARADGELEPASGPALIVVDDVDDAPPARARALLTTLSPGIEQHLVVLTHKTPVPVSVARQVGRVVPAERRRELGPIDGEAVRQIAQLYLDRSTDDVPVQLLLEESDGIPAAVHRVASQWARSAAARRLGESARRTSRERRDLRAAEADLIGDVASLEVARERSRLFVEVDEGIPDPAEHSITVCPYKGLAAFEAADAPYYFGRERLIAELIARMVGSAFIGLVGASGSGKSSALQAGLLPELSNGVLPGSDQWTQVLLRPGEHPMRELQLALHRDLPVGPSRDADVADSLGAALERMGPSQRLLLVVDQFEEIFAPVVDDAERLAFITCITEPRAGMKVLVAVRADQYERCAAYPRLARLLGADQVLVGPLGADELAAIIRHPAERVGLSVEPDLVDTLVADVGAEPGGLPLLSTALLELWEARVGTTLAMAAYRTSGGVQGAVARLAEGAYGRLDQEQQTLARAILLRLAGEDDRGSVVRRRVRLAELDASDNPEVTEVLRHLTAARLVTAGDGHVEVAHEALVREWPRLRGWIDEDGEGRRVRLHLTASARGWDEGGREDGDLYRGARLAATLDWSAEHAVELNAIERAFVEAGRAAAERDAVRQQRTNRWLRSLLAGVAAFLILAVGAGGIAVLQAQRAEDQRALAESEASRAAREERRAEDQADLARSRELAASAIATLDDDPSLSKLLALASASIADPPLESISALHQAISEDHVKARYVWPEDRDVQELWTDVDPTGRYLVAGGSSGAPNYYMEVFDLVAREVAWSWEVPPDVAIDTPTFSPSGDTIAAGLVWDPWVGQSDREDVRGHLGAVIWDGETGAVRDRFDLGPCGGLVQGVSDGHLLVRTFTDSPADCYHDSAEADTTLERIEIATGAREVVARHIGVLAATISRDGSLVVYEDAGDVVVFDVPSGARRRLFSMADTGQQDLFIRSLNYDGTLLLFGGRPIEVRDVATGEVVGSYDGHAGESWNAEFGADDIVYSTGRDGSLRIWRGRGADELAFLPGVGSGSVSPLSDRQALVANPESRTAAVVDTNARGEIGVIETCPGFVAAFSLHVVAQVAALEVLCDGDTIPSTVLANMSTMALRHTVGGQEGQTLAVSPDGNRFARQEGADPLIGGLTVRDTVTGEILVDLEGLCSWDWSLYVAGMRRVETGDCEPFPATPFPMYLWQVRWAPDGNLIAATDAGFFDGYVAVWDSRTGELVHAFARDQDHPRDRGWGPNDLTFTPDSSRLILGYGGTGARIAISTDTWKIVAEQPAEPGLFGGRFLGFAGFAPDGSLVGVGGFAGQGAGALHWFDADSLETIAGRSRTQVHEAAIKAFAMSSDGRQVATGAADGFVRVWDATTGRLEHEIPFGKSQIQGVAFVDNTHLAVAPQAGDIHVVTIDADELIRIGRQSLSRGFTETECARFGFASACPTLDEMRDG
jgi:WD40 repeat protein